MYNFLEEYSAQDKQPTVETRAYVFRRGTINSVRYLETASAA